MQSRRNAPDCEPNSLQAYSRASAIILFLSALAVGAQQEDANWCQFRGPRGDGKAIQARLPAEFSEAKNVRWKTAMHIHQPCLRLQPTKAAATK